VKKGKGDQIHKSGTMGKKPRIANQADMKIAIIGDEDTVTGMVMAGIGHVDGQGRKNFMVVDSKTRRNEIEEQFLTYTNRTDVAMILITQSIAEEIRPSLEGYTSSGRVVPTVLEIPSKDVPYDMGKDSIMQRVKMFFGANFDELAASDIDF